MDAVTLAMIKALGGSGSTLPSVSSADNGKVLGVADDGAWSAMSILAPSRSVSIRVNIDQDGSLSTSNTINYGTVVGLYNCGQLIVDLYRNDVHEQSVYCTLATDILNSLLWIFRGDYLDIITNSNCVLAVSFFPPHSPDSQAAEISIQKIEKELIVTLTPTALDYSGTMDKTVAEIWNAHNSGQDIVFRFMMGEAEYYDVTPNLFQHIDGVSYGGISASAILATNTFAEIRTVQSVSDGTVNNYYAHIYSLTPAS